jgi:hypothetical protein
MVKEDTQSGWDSPKSWSITRFSCALNRIKNVSGPDTKPIGDSLQCLTSAKTVIFGQ